MKNLFLEFPSPLDGINSHCTDSQINQEATTFHRQKKQVIVQLRSDNRISDHLHRVEWRIRSRKKDTHRSVYLEKICPRDLHKLGSNQINNRSARTSQRCNDNFGRNKLENGAQQHEKSVHKQACNQHWASRFHQRNSSCDIKAKDHIKHVLGSHPNPLIYVVGLSHSYS